MPVAGHALWLYATVLQGLQQCAAWLAVVLAVTKAAAAEQVMAALGIASEKMNIAKDRIENAQ